MGEYGLAVNDAVEDIEEQILEESHICERFRERFNISAFDQLEEIDYRALKESAICERLKER